MSTAAGQRSMTVTHPNRDKAAVRTTRAAVIALLLATIALVLIVSIGGGSAQEGLTLPVQYAFVFVDVVIVYMAIRWSRGSLPVASAIAVLLAIFALVGGSSWFEREHTYFHSSTLNPSLLGVLTFAIIPVQALLITFALRGFSQGWNVELERPASNASGQPA
jgi:hypothetical protein